MTRLSRHGKEMFCEWTIYLSILGYKYFLYLNQKQFLRSRNLHRSKRVRNAYISRQGWLLLCFVLQLYCNYNIWKQMTHTRRNLYRHTVRYCKLMAWSRSCRKQQKLSGIYVMNDVYSLVIMEILSDRWPNKLYIVFLSSLLGYSKILSSCWIMAWSAVPWL